MQPILLTALKLRLSLLAIHMELPLLRDSACLLVAIILERISINLTSQLAGARQIQQIGQHLAMDLIIPYQALWQKLAQGLTLMAMEQKKLLLHI